MKRLFNGSIAAIGLLIALVVVRTLMHQPPASINTDLVEIELNEAALAERLSSLFNFRPYPFSRRS